MTQTTEIADFNAIGLDGSYAKTTVLFEKLVYSKKKYVLRLDSLVGVEADTILLALIKENGFSYEVLTFEHTSRCYLVWENSSYILEAALHFDYYNSSNVFRKSAIDLVLADL